MSKIKNLNRFSKIITQDKSQGASQAMLHALKLTETDLQKAQVGIGSNWFESNPCNNHLNILSSLVKDSISKIDSLIGFRFNTIGVSDGISMGTMGMKYSLPSREIIADSYETIVKGHSYDSNISIPGCDKNMPGCLMAMLRINRPSFMIYGGSIKPGCFQGKEIDIVDAFQSYGNYLNDGDEEKRKGIIKNACNGSGACGGMYTANTMASAFEAMGVTLPGSASNPALSDEKFEECSQAGKTIEFLLENDLKPLDIITKKSFENAIATTIALGGSTNAVLHLMAVAHTANIKLKLEDFNRELPNFSNLKPSGDYLMYHLHQIGGIPLVMKILLDNGLLHGDCLTITGKTIKENLKDVSYEEEDIKHILDFNSSKDSHIRILRGNLSPNGSVAKITGKEGTKFDGTSKVFESEEQFMEYLENPNRVFNELEKFGKLVFIIRNQGPKGGPGMPEMLKPTSAIVGMGIKDNVAFITDGRFSGGSHGFIIGHVSPEAYDGGPISKVKNGDRIIIDSKDNSITWEENKKDLSGFLEKYIKQVQGAETGCVTN
jgi:dihydroxy-acid dehydratase